MAIAGAGVVGNPEAYVGDKNPFNYKTST